MRIQRARITQHRNSARDVLDILRTAVDLDHALGMKLFAEPEWLPKRQTERTPVTRACVERAVEEATQACIDSDDASACRVAWGEVEEISSEFHRQRRDEQAPAK